MRGNIAILITHNKMCRGAQQNVSMCIIVIPSCKLISCNQSIAIAGNLSCL